MNGIGGASAPARLSGKKKVGAAARGRGAQWRRVARVRAKPESAGWGEKKGARCDGGRAARLVATGANFWL